MTTLAELLDQAAADKLARLRVQLGQRQEAIAATPVQPVCPTCSQRLPVAAAVFQPAGGR